MTEPNHEPEGPPPLPPQPPIEAPPVQPPPDDGEFKLAEIDTEQFSSERDDSEPVSETDLSEAEVVSHEKIAKIKFSTRMPLKRQPEYGVCLWWPQAGTSWIHPHDVPKAEDFVPGRRVMKRSDFNDEYSLLTYGDLTVRVRPLMWLPIRYEGFDVGDTIETRSKMGRNEAFVATIQEMKWHDREKRIEYQLVRSGRVEHRIFLAEDIAHTEKLGQTLKQQEFTLNLEQAKKKQLATEKGEL